MSKDSHIIVRCEPELRARLERIALLEHRDLSNLVRKVFEEYVTEQEHTMNLVLKEGRPAKPLTLRKPVIYKIKRKPKAA